MTIKHRSSAVVIAVAMTTASAVLAETNADQDAGSDEAEPTEAQADLTAALASQPQVTAIRGGTLGIPSATTSGGLQAAFDAKTVGTTGEDDATEVDTSTFDFYTKLGRVSLTDRFELEVVADQFHMDLPRVVVGAPGAFPVRTTTELTSVGLRVSYRTDPKRIHVYGAPPGDAELSNGDAAGQREVNRTLDKLFEKTSGWSISGGLRVTRRDAGKTKLADFQEGGAFELMVQYQMHRRPGPDRRCEKAQGAAIAEAKAKEEEAKTRSTRAKEARDRATKDITALTADETRDATIASLIDGPAGTLAEASQKAAENLAAAERELAQAEADEAAATARLAELGKVKCVKPEDAYVTGFGSISGTYLEEEDRSIDGMMHLYPRWKELRFTAGVDFQTSKLVTGSKLLPRVGAYASVAWGVWTNEFGEPEQDDAIRARQWQAALYGSGHVYKGVSGLVSIGVLVPYGHETRPAFVLGFTPSFTSGARP